MFSIIGSGFGLYGYLPALILNNQKVALPERYYDVILCRDELSCYKDKVVWLSEEEINNKSTGLVCATCPSVQFDLVSNMGSFKNLKMLIMEKPIACNYSDAKLIFNNLMSLGINFRIGYTFLYTNWCKHLVDFVSSLSSSRDNLYIKWEFKAHHFMNGLQNWKRFRNMGGGVLRFYGIHIISILSLLGYNRVISSTVYEENAEEGVIWQASFSGEGKANCKIFINSNSPENLFKIFSRDLESVCGKETEICNLLNPFDGSQTGGYNLLDSRVFMLSRLCSSLLSGESSEIYDMYANVLDLWENVENGTEFCSLQKGQF